MRHVTKLLTACLGAAVALGAACADEHFPDPNVTATSPEGGADGGALESPPSPVDPSKRRDETSSPVIFDALRGGVWTANGDVGSVSYVDVDARQLIAEIPVGKDVRSVALSPDARWVAAVDRAAGSVVLVDAETRAVRATIPGLTHARAAVFDAWDPRWLYVALEDDDAIAVVDRSYAAVVRKVPVGRLPVGLGVSKARRELAIVHRIDAKVTIVPLDGVSTPGDSPIATVAVRLADSPTDDDPKKPQGRPFAFESIAWAPDGKAAWVPHELITTRQPFQFQSTVFPAISVVDFEARAEVVTDPGAGTFAGRKTLFGAINLPDDTGNTQVVSQPCAARIHPKGLVAYVLACGSEDLLTFDTETGSAIDLLRDIPGDHPIGIALDDTGTRAFVLGDESKTLATLDLEEGSPLAHVAVRGAAITVAKDTVDPETREGQKLFYRANSRKGDIATTGNNWMSCGACHLDGFVSTNQVFFDALLPPSRARDARIGHVALKDLFSTAPAPDQASFDPHDVLVAFTEQGGLAPDRTGSKRDGAIDPSAPTDAARMMARRVARIIARDLPLGPTWLLPGDKPNAAQYDGEWCGKCHQAEYDAWKKSAHSKSAIDPMVAFGADYEAKALGPQYKRLCAGCHAPVGTRNGDLAFGPQKPGVTCLGCHDTERTIRAGGNADSEARAHDWTKDHKDWAKASLDLLRKPEFCGTCHQQFVPGTGIEAISTLHEWQDSPYAAAGGQVTPCVDCHLADHAMAGGNVWLARQPTADGQPPDPAFENAENAKLRTAIEISGSSSAGLVTVHVTNRGAGHAFPTGVVDIREPWVELQAIGKGGDVLARFGGPAPDGLIPSGAARFGFDIARADGSTLFLHELSETTRIPFDRRIPAKSGVDVFLAAPDLPNGADRLDAVLFYRNVRTQYFRAATGDSTASAPDVEVARTTVQAP